jgi:hypothetical protein
LNIANTYSLECCKSEIQEETLICLDGGYLTYSQAKGYEFMSNVHDGSSGEIRPGYPLNLLVCRNGDESPFPVMLGYFTVMRTM